jgi:hypothetical protein
MTWHLVVQQLKKLLLLRCCIGNHSAAGTVISRQAAGDQPAAAARGDQPAVTDLTVLGVYCCIV